MGDDTLTRVFDRDTTTLHSGVLYTQSQTVRHKVRPVRHRVKQSSPSHAGRHAASCRGACSGPRGGRSSPRPPRGTLSQAERHPCTCPNRTAHRHYCTMHNAPDSRAYRTIQGGSHRPGRVTRSRVSHTIQGGPAHCLHHCTTQELKCTGRVVRPRVGRTVQGGSSD